MQPSSLRLNDIADFLRSVLFSDRYPTSEQGIYQPSSRPIQRLGVALEPFSDLTRWIIDNQLDALWLHRPWQLDRNALPPQVGVLYHHLPFDETLTIGYNDRLAELLNALAPLEPLGYKQTIDETGNELPPRPIGMLLPIPEREFDAYLYKISDAFGGYDRAEAGQQTIVGRAAVVGAMTDALVQEAAEQGATLYLTGQYRKPAQEAVDQTGMAVIAVGHRRSEEWGMRALAELLRERWLELTVVVRK